MNTPSQVYRRLGYRRPGRLHQGLDAVVHAALGRHARREQVLRDLWNSTERVLAMEPEFAAMGDEKLQEQLRDLASAVRRGGRPSENALPRAVAALREASRRQLGLHPFPVQILGVFALHQGCLAEMATGEGKTLTAGIAAVLAGWAGRPCHVVTVNDYLVRRDRDWLRPLHAFCGVSSGVVTSDLGAQERRVGHACDVTYTTSKELLADFLRDRMRVGTVDAPERTLIRRMKTGGKGDDGLVLRGLHTALVDEADSLLIDEAVTPLIISAPRENADLRDAVETARDMAESMELGEDYRVDPRYREIELTEAGREKISARSFSLNGFWRGMHRREEWVRQALSAREFFLRDKQYVVADGRLIIVDEFTGRPMPGRSWRQGLHQAVEAKEGLGLTDPSETIARMSFQRFFRLFHRLGGMTGTASESASELWHVYRLPVLRIPSNRPCVRVQHPDRYFADSCSKWDAIVGDIRKLSSSGRPILIGTRNVAASERLAERLSALHIPYGLLNAVRHQEEAAIVSEAGQLGRVTIATNMAGRGTDIKLGPGVAQEGGLHVIATERHESGRVDRQLFGRAGRQGDPGSAQAYVSAEDELLTRHLPETVVGWVRQALRSGWPRAAQIAGWAVRRAQARAVQFAFRQRKQILRTDQWLDDSLSFAGPPVGASAPTER